MRKANLKVMQSSQRSAERKRLTVHFQRQQVNEIIIVAVIHWATMHNGSRHTRGPPLIGIRGADAVHDRQPWMDKMTWLVARARWSTQPATLSPNRYTMTHATNEATVCLNAERPPTVKTKSASGRSAARAWRRQAARRAVLRRLRCFEK